MVFIAILLSTFFSVSALATPLTSPNSADGRQCGGSSFALCPRGYTCQMPLTPCDSPIACVWKCRPVWDQAEGRPCGNEGDLPCLRGFTCIIPLILCPPGEEERCRGWIKLMNMPLAAFTPHQVQHIYQFRHRISHNRR
ncbi:hypothetical protein B0T18DRAFT_392991 [Schizothecium vesticola]|uniref:Uncharacterized protein n=1 Tax=Schizothecium vesticola TaxID=314040 RepID=A0AA40BTM3_9PEZI|nr:hypothetical protein B0T18DRAFT_392991 [Schizothecium vesticola]